MNEAKIGIGDASRAMIAGKHILVICKSAYEAHESAKELFDLMGGRGVLQRSTVSVGSGSVEFGWCETASGRRLDDFDRQCFSIEDGFKLCSIPARVTINFASGSLDREVARAVQRDMQRLG